MGMEVLSLHKIFMTPEVEGGASYYLERIKVLAPHSPFSDTSLAGAQPGCFFILTQG